MLPPVSYEQERTHLNTALALPPDTAIESSELLTEQRTGRGRPLHLPQGHLWLGLLWAVLEGVQGYSALARYLATHPLGHIAPVSLACIALLQRLQQAGYEPLQHLFCSLGTWLQAYLAPPACDLAPFASHILALDETKLDAVVRRLPWQRQHRLGDPALLAGKLAAVFDIRAQRWVRVQYLADALRNCKQEALSLLAELPWHSLLLFDLGYFSFPFFDYLTERGYYWISRYREKTHYQLVHVYYRHHEMLDALVWLGCEQGVRSGSAVRLVRFGSGTQLYLYFTNVLDPLQLPMGDIARLYARRWDIELAFLTIKDLCGLRQWWSSQRPLILQQIAVVLLLAQLVQALRLPLLVEHLAHLLRARLNPVTWVLTYGKQQQLLRPSSRYHVVAPCIPPEQLIPLPADLKLTRKARFVTYQPRPPRPSYNSHKHKSSSSQKRSPSSKAP